MSIESVMPSNHLILCHPLCLLPSIFPSIRVFSNESAFRIRWSKYWSFGISPFNEYSGLISFRIDWFDLLAVQGTLKSLLQHHSSHHTWCKELTPWKKPWCWERLKAGGKGDDRRWDGWMASPTQWTWVWASSGCWWCTGKPDVLQFMGSQRVRHDWVIERNWYPSKLLRDRSEMFSSHTQNRKFYDKMEVSVNATVVAILQHINISNQHIVHVKVTCQWYANYMSDWTWNEWKRPVSQSPHYLGG